MESHQPPQDSSQAPNQAPPSSDQETYSPPSQPDNDTDSLDDAVEAALKQFQPDRSKEPTDDRAEREEGQRDKLPDGEQDAVDAPEKPRDADAPTEGGKPDASKNEPRASAWASFHRQQREHQQKVEAFAQERQELNKLKEAIADAKVDRLKALELLGYDDPRAFIEGIAEDGGRMTPERKELHELKKWREKQETESQERAKQETNKIQQAQQKQNLDRLRTSVVNTIKGSFSDTLASLPGGEETVLREMDQMVANNPGTMPRIEDAISAVNKFYQQQMRSLVENPSARQFMQQLLSSDKSASQGTAPSQKPVTRTLGSDASPRSSGKTEPYVPSIDGEREIDEILSRYKRRGI